MTFLSLRQSARPAAVAYEVHESSSTRRSGADLGTVAHERKRIEDFAVDEHVDLDNVGFLRLNFTVVERRYISLCEGQTETRAWDYRSPT